MDQGLLICLTLPMAIEELPSLHPFAARLLQVGAEIIALHTKLPLNLCNHLIETCLRKAMIARGYTALPGQETPLHERYAFAQTVIRQLGNELAARKIDAELIALLQNDLDAFYRGVRGIASHATDQPGS